MLNWLKRELRSVFDFCPDGLDTTAYEARIEQTFKFEIDEQKGTRLKTLGELCDYITSEMTARGRSADADFIWTKVRRFTSEEFGVDESELTKDIRFIEDLNF